jgi:hypothetical protein
MADEPTVTLQPVIVAYDPITGVPSEYNENLPPECNEYKRWKATQDGPEALEALTLRDKDGNEIVKKQPGGKQKTKAKATVRGSIWAGLCVAWVLAGWWVCGAVLQRVSRCCQAMLCVAADRD